MEILMILAIVLMFTGVSGLWDITRILVEIRDELRPGEETYYENTINEKV